MGSQPPLMTQMHLLVQVANVACGAETILIQTMKRLLYCGRSEALVILLDRSDGGDSLLADPASRASSSARLSAFSSEYIDIMRMEPETRSRTRPGLWNINLVAAHDGSHPCVGRHHTFPVTDKILFPRQSTTLRIDRAKI